MLWLDRPPRCVFRLREPAARRAGVCGGARPTRSRVRRVRYERAEAKERCLRSHSRRKRAELHRVRALASRAWYQWRVPRVGVARVAQVLPVA